VTVALQKLSACPTGLCLSEWVAGLVREHRARLLGIARRQGLSPEEAFDCVQEAFGTFLRLPEALGVIDRPEESARLLTTITKNAARTRRRSVARATQRSGAVPVEELLDEGAPPDELVDQGEQRASLRQCVLSLTEVQRAVVTLRMLEDIPGNEVAERLGLSPQNVAVLLHRAKASLRDCMTAAGHG
jgi:RNA polymerase sigma-70 factor, ECF subfamily